MKYDMFTFPPKEDKKVMKWRDGEDMVCEICEKPIYVDEPMESTITQAKKKRHCNHFICKNENHLAILGNNQITIIK